MKMIKTILALVGVVACTSSAFALSITPATGTLNVTRWEGTVSPPNTGNVEAWAAAVIANETMQYKFDGGEGGGFAGSYAGSFGSSDPSAATITWTGGSFINPASPGKIYLLVK